MPSLQPSLPARSCALDLAASEHRPRRRHVDRVLGEPGMPQDTVAGRQIFERKVETSEDQRRPQALGHPPER